MPLQVPKHILESDIQSHQTNYQWDEWDLEHIFEDNEPAEFDAKVDNLSYRAQTALTVAITEWIIHRYRIFPEARQKEVDLSHIIEAGWAGVVDGKYHRMYKPNEDPDVEEDWKGPIMFPIAIANVIIVDAIVAQEQEAERTAATYISCLARHVLPNTTSFLSWRDQVLDKLVAQYPYDTEETLGEVVPREFFDIHTPFNIDSTEQLINNFLRTIDYKNNPYLNLPETMTDIQFKGKPYHFDIEAERKARVEW